MTDTDSLPRWGIVSTIKAEARDILTFAAYHLEQGAHRLFLYLDAPCPDAHPLLKAHPKVRVIDCDDSYWKRQPRERPDKHQVRQTYNANRALRKQGKDVDWIAHIDVDEFLTAPIPIAERLAELPEDALCARVYPVEALSDSTSYFRAPVEKSPDQAQKIAALYPRFGAYVRRGMFSHSAGKLFVRTSLPELRLRIHNAYVGDLENPCQVTLKDMDLCHIHARNWDHWLAHYRYRHAKGAYRAELKAASGMESGGMTKHALLSQIEAEEGETGLRNFYDEFNANTKDLRDRLHAEGLLRHHELNLDATLQKHFPNWP